MLCTNTEHRCCHKMHVANSTFFAVHGRYLWHDSLCGNTNRRNAYNQLLAASIYDATLSISMLLHTGMALASEAHINSRA